MNEFLPTLRHVAVTSAAEPPHKLGMDLAA